MSSMARIPSGLELTIAAPGFSFSSASGGDGPSGGGCNRLELDINLPVMPEDDFSMSSVDDAEEDDGGGAAGDPRPKKLRLTKEQTRLLEESFRLTHTPNPKQKEALALKLQLRPRQVEVWFQNRRARTKLKQTEVECHYLKRCYNSLTEENRRLQREVEELRALKVAPPTVLSPHTRQPMPASALTMCPRCQQITAAEHHWTTPIAPPRLGLRLLGHQL